MKLAEIESDRADQETFAEIAQTYRKHGIGFVRGCVFDPQTFESLSKYLCDCFHLPGQAYSLLSATTSRCVFE